MARDFNESSEQFLASLDAEIERLQTMREQVAAALGAEPKARTVGRPKRKGMSEEGRRKIAEAQKARWAKQKGAVNAVSKRGPAKKAAATKTAVKKSVAKKAAKEAAARNTSAA